MKHLRHLVLLRAFLFRLSLRSSARDGPMVMAFFRLPHLYRLPLLPLLPLLALPLFRLPLFLLPLLLLRLRLLLDLLFRGCRLSLRVPDRPSGLRPCWALLPSRRDRGAAQRRRSRFRRATSFSPRSFTWAAHFSTSRQRILQCISGW
ncbi:putative transmembrane protein [Toxoplasma gondii GAB2-2007-GAL-DOM2]|uniref:Putative transmembrane protein n=1 Tax=Toxoplasma gondii GAB2-2007-GAL-DOM2 TaxID=1130820 RepID=A0A086KCJ6_TOXGO|nr:putative transmembrane protein [Toxoplasma gondii GAB2-2007-GAL-DOM2]